MLRMPRVTGNEAVAALKRGGGRFTTSRAAIIDVATPTDPASSRFQSTATGPWPLGS